ncbi:ATP-binding cassette domain-containing protein [Pimelobacter simplex]|uniref:ABC transporter ATP-binding protein n=1 Tax=Nocardioides simplex TaxID=2045 RepID=UPI0005361C0C|nr:ATP-binding cassette domain-containing protein [Pimelobacter simplex]MCG8154300.1 ATP-binding cassette domain-containing protein [Pimelobacter simplex]GEB11746.1 ABC transporter ATP-binding protein [Pimelobacter simplex]SFN01151.1 ABC-2 type transport system ATP-binding protein [Pimelobacter simplex]
MTVPPLVIDGLTKQFGAVKAVDDLAFTVRPGAVTGFLGPNGAGKTTTLRMLLGLTRPTAGRALVGDRPYTSYERPGTVVGAALEASSFHPGRTGLGHLEVFAPQVGVSKQRCRQVLEAVGLDHAAKQRVGKYSLGMRQRLGLATALLADPPVIVLDEPTNGLDPEGIVWIRRLLRQFAAEGRTVLVSSHLLREVEASVDDVVVIAQGRLRHASTLAELRTRATPAAYVETPRPDALATLAADRGWTVQPDGDGTLVDGANAAEVGAAAHAAGLELHELVRRDVDLEALFFELTRPEEAR